MTTLRIAAALALVGSSAACNTGGPEDDEAPPATCNELFALKQNTGMRVEGMYDLFLDNNSDKPWVAYCVIDTPVEATEYLPLPHSLQGSNESGWLKGESEPLIASFVMVPIDPSTLVVRPDDFRFAAPLGKSGATLAGSAPALPFGLAFAKGGSAWSSIDLRGTAFSIDPAQFVTTGRASVTASEKDQVIDIQADVDGEVTTKSGSLQLGYIGTAAPADEAAAAEAGIELTEAPQP